MPVPSVNGVHVDFRAVWADPKDKMHILLGCDGGAYESVDEGKTWKHFANLPVTQFYRVAIDNALPFSTGNVCGWRAGQRVDVRAVAHAGARR